MPHPFLDRLLGRHLPPIRQGRLAVLGYHRVGDPSCTPWDPDLITATAAQFDRHIQYLKRHHGIVGAEEALHLLTGRRTGRRGGAPPVLLTFDDGYLDNYTTAFPVLRSHGVTGLFFLVVDHLRGVRVPWWDAIAWMCQRARGQASVGEGAAREGSLGGARAEAAAIIARYKSLDADDAQALLDALPSRLGVTPPTDARELFLSVDQAREMMRGGMSVGAHTCTHPVLSRVGLDVQRRELCDGKAWLESALGRPVVTLAYPVGSPDAFTEVTMREARQAGYVACFSYHGGINDLAHTNLLDVKRIPVYLGVPDEDLIRSH